MAADHVNGARILVVDDEPMSRQMALDLVERLGFRGCPAETGQDALRKVLESPPDVILLDAMMPGLTGFEICRRLKANPETDHIPVIMLTALEDVSDYVRAIEHGADDFLHKPFDSAVLEVRLKALLKAKRMRDELIDYRKGLEQKVADQTLIIREVQDVTVFSLAKLAEYRDPETGEHLERMRHYCALIARGLSEAGLFEDQIDEAFIHSIVRSSVLHDIGKVGIPDSILLKPGRLTPQEFEIMKLHSKIGGDALNDACRRLQKEQFKEEFLDMARAIAYHHHEKFDGSGYPAGLAGEAIPLAARIVAVADVYDALLSKRPYKEPMPQDKALAILRDGHGTHFDPVVLDCFLDYIPAAADIAQRFKDSESIPTGPKIMDPKFSPGAY